MLFERTLRFELPRNQSAFLWGPRKTGKSTWLRQRFPDSLVYDFLKTDLMVEASKDPSVVREEIISEQERGRIKGPVVIDEVQKVPQVLDEVHWLIENRGISFILCGSSARALKREKANMLGGRAWRFQLHPLTRHEIPEFDLLRALNHGLIPSHYLSSSIRRTLRSYVNDYLREEIREEGLVRNFRAFSRFTDVLGFNTGELVNYNNIARETAVDAKTVKEYFQIVHDTMLGAYVEPYRGKGKRSALTATPKFYLFDTGVASYLSGRTVSVEEGPEFGRALEHFIWMELCAYNSYSELDFPIRYWRTTKGHEVDFVLGNGDVAVEITSTKAITNKHTRGLRSFLEENKPGRAIIVNNAPRACKSGVIEVLPWRQFLSQLWSGKLVS